MKLKLKVWVTTFIGIFALLNFLLPFSVSADSGPIYWGAIIKGQYGDAPWNMTGATTFESHAGKGLSIIHFGGSWYSNGVAQNFPTNLFDNVRNHGSIPLFSWSSRETTLPNDNQPNFRNSVITSGVYDDYIRKFATDAKNWGHPFFLRFDWEMNGWWYPWAEGKKGTSSTIVNGNQAGDYAAMWKHVHDIFDEVGATNVTWVWCINQMSNTSTGQHPPMAQIYPGDSYVDWTGFDNYNRYAGWESFNTMITGFGTNWLLNTYQETANIAPSKPMMLAEFGSKEDNVDPNRKANWYTDALLTQLPTNFPQIKAVVYFNWNTTSDPLNPDSSIVIESTPQSQAAFAAGIGSNYYASNTFANLANTKIVPLQPTTSPTPTPTSTPIPTPTSTPTPTPTPAINMLANPSFENTGSTWINPWIFVLKTGAAASVSQDTSLPADGTASAKIITTTTGGIWYNVTLDQRNLTFETSKTYAISFWARSSANRTSRFIIQKNYSPYTEYLKTILNVTPTWQKYNLTFTSPVTDSNLKISVSAADSTGTLWLDGFSIVKTN